MLLLPSALLGLLYCWKHHAMVVQAPATGCSGAEMSSQSEKRCRVGLCAWATEMIRYNFSNHFEYDPDCHCLGMCLRLSFHGPE